VYKKRGSTVWNSLDTMDCSEETPLVDFEGMNKEATTLKRGKVEKKKKQPAKEEIPVCKMVVDEKKKEEPDLLLLLIKKTIDTILLEEASEIGIKMDKYRGVLSGGI